MHERVILDMVYDELKHKFQKITLYKEVLIIENDGLTQRKYILQEIYYF